MYMDIRLIIFQIIVFVIIILAFYCMKFDSRIKNKKNKGKISEWSYQRYARFYGNTLASDENFNKKLDIIYDLIINRGKTDIKEIAKLSSCTYEECILKIKYLKNKRKIGDLYIDSINGIINKCSAADKKMLDKYKKFIYYNHYQIDEIAANMHGATLENMDSIKEKVLKDLLYLDEKGLLNGIIINPIDEKITYYTIEKHKNEKDFITINCSSCGAINDVNRNGKTRCEYCKRIIEHKK